MSEKFYLESVLNATQFAISEIKNENLRMNAETIRKASATADLANGTIATAFAECARIIAHEETEYESIQDFGAKVFGLKKSQSYSLAVIGAHQIPRKDAKGRVIGYTDDFTTDPAKPYMNTALQLIITYTHKYNSESVTEFVRKECNSEMSYRTLKQKLIERFDKPAKIEQKTDNGTAQNTDNGTAQNTDNGTAQNTDNGTAQKVKCITVQIPETAALAMKLALLKFSTESEMIGTLIDVLTAGMKAKSNSVRLEKCGSWNGKTWIPSEIK